MKNKKILFLCTGNSCRSQMAEGYAKDIFKDTYEFYSAGVEAHGMNKMAIKVMEEDNISLSDHYSKALDKLKHIDFDLVITLCGDAHERCPTYLKKAVIVHKGFSDPAKAHGTDQQTLKVFREVRDNIKYYIKNELLQVIKKL